MNVLVSVLLVATSFWGLAFQHTPKVNTKDLQRLSGAQWSGTLTYLDYRTNKKVSILSDLSVTQLTKDKLSWVFDYRYPKEPKANSRDTVVISGNGTIIDGETVIERTNLDGDTVRVVTEKSGTDNNKNALLRFTYLFSAGSFSVKKEVRYEGTNEFIERNQYSWKRR